MTCTTHNMRTQISCAHEDQGWICHSCYVALLKSWPLDRLEKFRQVLRKAGRDADEDVVLEAMDFLVRADVNLGRVYVGR